MSVGIFSRREGQNNRSVYKSEKNLPLGLIISTTKRAMLNKVIINMQGFFSLLDLIGTFYPLIM